MIRRIALTALVGGLSLNVAAPQEVVTYKVAVVALLEDPEVRAAFEEGLAAKFREHNYDAVTSYEIVPDVTELDDADFIERLAAEGIQASLVVRPAAIGAGSTLESVRRELFPEIFSDMQTFAGEISSSGGEDLLAVIHMAIYLITEDGAELISAGATWLDEEVESAEQGIERLHDLIVANVDAVRPAIREHLGLPPLE